MPGQISYHKHYHATVILVISLILLIACRATQPTSTADVQTIYTEAANTLIAQFTLDAGNTAVARLTALAQNQSTLPATAAAPTETPSHLPNATATQSATSIPPTPEPSITLPPTATATATMPPPTATPATPCEAAQWQEDVTIPDGSSFPVGASFTKIWRVQNTGACTWNSNYVLTLVSGNPLGKSTVFPLPGVIVPGAIVDLAIDLNAPAWPGAYQGNWALRSPVGSVFGVGKNGAAPLSVRINALQPAAWNNPSYDLAANYCAARWKSAAGELSCPEDPDSSNGSVLLQENQRLESRRDPALALLAWPNQERGGWISGQFPFYTIQKGEHFISEIGCLEGYNGCNLTFQLDYRTLNGALSRLGRWDEVYDGQTTPIDIDLSALAGSPVQFILTVYNNDKPRQGKGFWLDPRLQKGASSSAGLALHWTREAKGNTSCDSLKIYLARNNSAEAQAFSCTNGERLLGRQSLSTDDLNQLLYWLQNFASFDGEVYHAFPDQAVAYWFTIGGYGSLTASNSDINAINSFAERIFTLAVGQ